MIDSISAKYPKVLFSLAALTLCVTFLSNSALNASFLLFGLVSLFTMRKSIFKIDKGIFIITGLFFISGLLSNIMNFSELANVSKSFRGLRFFFFAPFFVSSFYLIFSFLLQDPSRKNNVLNWFLILTSIASLSGLIGLYTGFNYLRFKSVNHDIRNAGMYGMYMTYAYGISLFLTLNLGAIFHYKRFKNIVNFPILCISALLNLIGLYFSYTRGALLGLAFSLPFLFVKSRKQLIALLLIVSTSFSVFVFFTESGKHLFLSSSRIRSNMERIAFFKGAIYGFLESPVVGLGVKNIEPNMVRLKVKNNVEDRKSGHSHNIYLEVLANQGLLGIIILISFLFYSFKIFINMNEAESFIALGFFANFCFSGLFQNTFGDSENLQFMIIIWAVFVAWYLINKRSYLKSL